MSEVPFIRFASHYLTTAAGGSSKQAAQPKYVEKQKQNTVFLVAMLILGVSSIFISFAAMAICYRFAFDGCGTDCC